MKVEDNHRVYEGEDALLRLPTSHVITKMAVERSSPLSQPVMPATIHSEIDWNTLDSEFSSIIAPIHFRLSANDLDTTEAGEIVSSLLKALLEQYGAIKGKSTTRKSSVVSYYQENQKGSKNYGEYSEIEKQ